MLQDGSRHFSTELSEVAEEEYPRNRVGRETFRYNSGLYGETDAFKIR
jgi:hypothetical protein